MQKLGNPDSAHGPRVQAGLGIGVLGLIVLAASFLGLFPLVSMARLLSNDGILSEEYVRRIVHSQWLLGAAFMLAAPLPVLGANAVSRVEAWLRRCRPMTFSLLLGSAIFAVTLAVQFFFFENIPHMTDAISHMFEARIMNLGRTYVPLPPCPEHFFQDHILMINTGKWFSKYTPGHALLLLFGLKTGLVWAVVPFLSAVAGVLLTGLVTRFYGCLFGRIAGLLYLLSPLVLLLGASFMSHTTALALSLIGICLFIRAFDLASRPLMAWAMAAAAGFFLAWAAIDRPPEFVILILIGVMTFLLTPPRHWPRMATLLVPLVIGSLPVVLFMFKWNESLYGHALAAGYGFTSSQVRRPPFQAQFGFNDNFTPAQAVQLTVWTLTRFDRVLLGWPSSLILVPLALLTARWTRREVLCVAGSLTVMTVYFFYSYYGFEYEARYYYMAAPFFLVLTVRGLQRLVQILSRWSADAARPVVAAVMLAFFAHGLVDYWHGYLWPIYGKDYEEASSIVHRLAERDQLHQAIVLIGQTGPDQFRYSSGMLFNDPLLTNDVIYARDLPEGIQCLFDQFPARAIYRFVPLRDWTDGRFERVKRDQRVGSAGGRERLAGQHEVLGTEREG